MCRVIQFHCEFSCIKRKKKFTNYIVIRNTAGECSGLPHFWIKKPADRRSCRAELTVMMEVNFKHTVVTEIFFHSFTVYLDIFTSLFVQMNAQLHCSRIVETYIEIYNKMLLHVSV